MIHILHILLGGYQHIHGTCQLLRFYARHGAVKFLMSGITSETPANRAQAWQLLTWLTRHHISPTDW